MPPFNPTIGQEKNRLTRHEAAVEGGYRRLEPPQFVRQQMQEAAARFDVLFEPGRKRPDALLPSHPDLLLGWLDRQKEIEEIDVPLLQAAGESAAIEAAAVAALSAKLSDDLARARQVLLKRPVPDSVRALSFWERLGAGLRQFSYSAFLVREEVTPQPPTVIRISLQELLSKPLLTIAPITAAEHAVRGHNARDWPELAKRVDDLEKRLSSL